MSVIVPAYNAEKYIAEALESLLAQTLADFEAIVVNDGSADATQAVIDAFCARDSRFICLSQPNSGVSAARNNALKRVTGRYVAFLDSDDKFTEGSLQAFFEALEETGADMAVCRLKSFGAIGEKDNPYADKLAKKKNINAFDMDLVWNFLIGNKCFRRETLERAGVSFPPLRYSEDGAFIYNVMLPSGRAVGAPDACYRYRRHDFADASVTQTVNAALVRDYIDAMKLIYGRALETVSEMPLDVDAEAFLRELVYKADFALITQFYRLFWQADSKTLNLIGAEHKRLQSMMNDATRQKAAAQWADIGEPVFSRALLASMPKITVIVTHLNGMALESTVNAVFYQSMPAFELIITQSEALSGAIPQRWLQCENVVVLPDKGFIKNAKRASRSKKRLVIKRECKADVRLFKYLLNLGLSEQIKNRFFGLLFRAAKKAVEMKRL